MTQGSYQLGYARVSTADQDPALQIDALKAAGCDRIFIDHGVSGTSARKPELEKLLDIAREGDTLVVWKFDRVGRVTSAFITLVHDLDERGVKFRSLTEGISTEGAMGKFVITLFAGLAQMERDILVERTMAGLAAARARGRVGGRPAKLSPEQERAAYQMYSADELSVAGIAAVLGVAKSTADRAIKRQKELADPDAATGVIDRPHL